MKKTVLIISLSLLCYLPIYAAILKGKVTDSQSKESLIGASVQIISTKSGAMTDVNGNYKLHVPDGTYDVLVRYVGYLPKTIKGVKIQGTKVLNILLREDARKLNEVLVVGEVKKNTETSQISGQRHSLVVQSGVSAQFIARSQDKDASEVIKRIPGVSIINDKFVMVRGLSQRYNNVWINSGAVPSSEPDSRAFSFDLIPSSQIDNMAVIKSPAPEYPADFTGGFIMVQTKEIPSHNSLAIKVGLGLNDRTQFRNFLYTKGSRTDWLGFDDGLRNLRHGIHTTFPPIPGKPNSPDQKYISLLGNGFNNDWTIKQMKALPNGSLGLDFAHRWVQDNGNRLGAIGAVNYSNSYTTFLDMDNNFYGAYDEAKARSVYLRKAKDDQYNHNVRIGGMFNLSYAIGARHSFELKNIFNQLGNERYTLRRGIDAQDNQMQSAEYYYASRRTYNGQFTGKHTYDHDNIDWSIGYAYSDKNMPDRRRYVMMDQLEPGKLGINNSNDINREYTFLKEHIGSGALNYKHTFGSYRGVDMQVKAGLYGEYRKRRYSTRDLVYNWEGQNQLPQGFRYFDVASKLMQDQNYGPDKLYLLELPHWTNNYHGSNALGASYLSTNMDFGRLKVYAGVRWEYNRMVLTRNTKDVERSPYDLVYTYNDLFPSLNTTFSLSKNNQLRLSYGRTVNRPEFREVSPSVFYDFELGSSVQGNTDLQACYNDNYDFRYEYYPSTGEMASIALFYKHFKNPIEWVYTMSGGTDAVYSFKNAQGAYSLGVELDLKKDLAFIGLKNFSLSLNASLIRSEVQFPKDAKERNRPMQGQSPYLINAGLFYQNKKGSSLSLLYNRIGKRIIGVGRSIGAPGEVTIDIPNAYEMPRNMLDVNFSQKLGQHFTLRLGVKDLLGEKVLYKQFNTVTLTGGKVIDVEETTKSFYPGRRFNLSVSYQF